MNVNVVSECVDGKRIDPPYYLAFDANGQVLAAYSSGRNERSVSIAPDVYVGTGWLSFPCVRSNVPVPRIDRPR